MSIVNTPTTKNIQFSFDHSKLEGELLTSVPKDIRDKTPALFIKCNESYSGKIVDIVNFIAEEKRRIKETDADYWRSDMADLLTKSGIVFSFDQSILECELLASIPEIKRKHMIACFANCSVSCSGQIMDIVNFIANEKRQIVWDIYALYKHLNSTLDRISEMNSVGVKGEQSYYSSSSPKEWLTSNNKQAIVVENFLSKLSANGHKYELSVDNHNNILIVFFKH